MSIRHLIAGLLYEAAIQLGYEYQGGGDVWFGARLDLLACVYQEVLSTEGN
jgi:hypothetical protein